MRIMIQPADPLNWHRTGSVRPCCTSDACHQGRRSCPTPAACEVPEPELPVTGARPLVLYLLTAAVALGSAAIHFWPQIVAAFLD